MLLDTGGCYSRKSRFLAQKAATEKLDFYPFSPSTTSKVSIAAHWMKPDLGQCPILVETIPDLEHIQVTPGLSRFFRTTEPVLKSDNRAWIDFSSFSENAHEVVEMMESLLRNQSTLSYNDLLMVLNKLKDVVNISVVTTTLAQALIDIISDILESDSDLLPFTNT